MTHRRDLCIGPMTQPRPAKTVSRESAVDRYKRLPREVQDWLIDEALGAAEIQAEVSDDGARPESMGMHKSRCAAARLLADLLRELRGDGATALR